jgi:hypothetical protein
MSEQAIVMLLPANHLDSLATVVALAMSSAFARA